MSHLLSLLFCHLLFALQLFAAPASYVPNDPSTSFGVSGVDATYDYVIIGGGTAGLAVASRLAENPNITVAVIEAGGFYEASDGNVSVVPGYCTVYAGTAPNDTDPLVDWGFITIPQTVSYGVGEQNTTFTISADSRICRVRITEVFTTRVEKH